MTHANLDIYRNIPQELRERTQWILWRKEWKENRQTKIPYRLNGYKASTTDPQTWDTFERVLDTYQARKAPNDLIFHPGDPRQPAEQFHGIGFVFAQDDPYTGIDFDRCVSEGQITKDFIKDALKMFNTYTERSQSGNGIHTIIKAKLPSDRGRKNTQLDIEIYEKERFFVMTGNFIQGTPLTIEERQDELNAWFPNYFPDRQQPRREYTNQSGGSPNLSDDDIIRIANGARNGEVFKKYFYNGPDEDHSSSDLALCNILAFYTQDFDQIDRLFRQSACMREKWDERRGAEYYNEKTINAAISGLTATYTPTRRRNPEPADSELNWDWTQDLETTKKGIILSNSYNVLLILNNDENLKGRYAFNLLTQRPEIIGSVPWTRISEIRDITDHDDSCLRNYFSIHYGIKAKDLILDGIAQKCGEKKYHPVRKYLKSVYGTWDGKPRLENLLIDFFGAEDTELNRWQTKLTFVGAVQRAFEAGSKMDYVLTLKGGQGLGKSSFFKTISVRPEWFTDSLDDIRGKEAKEQIRGNWIIELGEMAAVGKADQKRLKQFITSTEDEFRESYGRRTGRYPRQCLFVATTNDDLPLKDDTGGRRWWIVEVKEKWFKKNKPLEIDQLWAEAMEIYRKMKADNQPIMLPDHVEEEAQRIQSDNTDKGLFAGTIEEALSRGFVEYQSEYGARTNRIEINKTCAFHIWEVVLKRHLNDINKGVAREINAVLKNLDGWENIGRVQFEPYGKQTVYQRKSI